MYNQKKCSLHFRPYSAEGIIIVMKYFRSGVGVIFALIVLLSSCAVSDTPAHDNSEGINIVGGSLTDGSITTPEPDDDTVTIPGEPDDDPAATSEESGSTSGVDDDPATIPAEDDSTSELNDNSATTPEESDVTVPEHDNGEDTTTSPITDAHVHVFVGATCTEAGKCECGAAGAALGHDFAEAGCTAPSTCKRCGNTSGKALGHNYTDATCTAPGKCTRCGAKSSALGHDFAAATCTAPRTCKRCGTTSGSALGHSLTSATCTDAAVCTRCGKTSGKALGHNYTGATCTAPGKCTRCGAKSSAVGHDYTAATCTTPGKCTRCGAKNSALGHDFAAATCTAPRTCKRCGTTSGSALGHNYSGGKCKNCGDTNGPLTPEEAKLFKNKLTDEENAQALAAAREIVRQIEKEYPKGSDDFERIAMAASLVSDEYYKGVHVEEGIYYNQAYGVFIKRESSCAGCCRALGLVLSCMGYEWTHVNEHQWQHQWVEVTVNGETIWADGQIGWAGYGEYPFA